MAKGGTPDVVLIVKYLRHDLPEKAGGFIKVRLFGLLAQMQGVQILVDAAGFFLIKRCCFLVFACQELSQDQLFEFALVAPVIQTGVIGKHDIDIRAIVSEFIAQGRMLFKRMGDAAALVADILRLIETGQQKDQESGVVA